MTLVPVQKPNFKLENVSVAHLSLLLTPTPHPPKW